MNRGRSGISPVVATVILVAIAIVIAIAVAFWATGLVGVFTRFEKLEITSAYAQVTGNEIDVILRVRNTGSADATIDDIYVNGIPCQATGTDACGVTGTGPISVGADIQITVDNPPEAVTNGQWAHGVTYEIVVHTASGKSYPVAVLIP